MCVIISLGRKAFNGEVNYFILFISVKVNRTVYIY